MGQHLLVGAAKDQNRDLQCSSQLVNNIERVLNSFEFLEQELDRSEPAGGHTSNDQHGTKGDQRKAQQAKSSLDNSITTGSPPNPTGVTSSVTSSRFEQTGQRTMPKNTAPSTTVNKSSAGETKNTLVPNCLQRDLTFLGTGSTQQQQQQPKTTPSPCFEVATLDDYDDIQTVAANCNVTEYLNQNNLAGNSGSSSDKTADKSDSTNGTADTLASGSISVLNGRAERNKNESPTSSPVKDNRFVKEDCKNNKINKLKTLFRPVKVGLADRQKRAKEAGKQGNLAAKLSATSTVASATTTDLIKKENKERKDDSQLVADGSRCRLAGENEENNLKTNLATAGTNLVKDDLKTVEVVNGKFVVVAVGKQSEATAVGSEEEKKITANDQLVDHLIGQNLRAKIDSENNGNSQSDNYGSIADQAAVAADQAVVLVKNKAAEQAANARIEILNTKSVKSAPRSSLPSNRSIQSFSEKCAEQTDESGKHRAPAKSVVGSQPAGVVSQTNANAFNKANQACQTGRSNQSASPSSVKEQSSAELELNAMQPDEQMIANQSVVTIRASASNKTENKSDTKLDKKSNQPTALKSRQATATNELNHASRAVRRTPINQQNVLSATTTNQTSNQMPLVVKISTRPKVIELTKSSDLKSKLGTSIVRAAGNSNAFGATNPISVAKLKRTPSDHDHDQSNSSANSSGSSATVTGLHKKSGGSSANKSTAVITNNCQAAKSANQIKCKTISKPRCPPPSKNETTCSAAVVNGAISKSIGSQLKTNSIKVLNAGRAKVQTTNKANSTESKQSNRELEQQVANTLKKSQNRKPNPAKPASGSNLSSASSSAASSVSSINLASNAGGSQSSIASNQVKVNRSASLTLQRTGSLKQAATSNSSNNNSLPRRSKSIYALTGTAEKERTGQKTIASSMSKEDVHQMKDNHPPKDIILDNGGQPMEERGELRSTGEDKSNKAKDRSKSNGRMMIDGNETSQLIQPLIQVADQNQILIDEPSSTGANGVTDGNQNDGRMATPTDGNNSNGSRSKVDNQSKKSNLTSPNVNKVTSAISGAADGSSVSPVSVTPQVSENDSHATGLSTAIDKVQPSADPAGLEAFVPFGEDGQINGSINKGDANSKDDKKLSDEEQLNLLRIAKPNDASPCMPTLAGDRLDNELNKSEIDYLKQSNSKTETIQREPICEERNAQRSESTALGGCAARTAKRTTEGGDSAFCGGAQVHSTGSAGAAVLSSVRKEKLSQLKSNDQQVKKQINELIECVKKSEFLLSQTIDCQPLTIEIFDGLDDSESGKPTDFNYAESTAVQSASSENQKTDNDMFLLEEAPSSKEQQPVASGSTKMNHVNSAGANYSSKIVNNKILNSSKSSDLGGSSSATSSSDESTGKSPDELDAVERAGLTRKDSVSSSSSSICSSSGSTSGSSSGVSSSHSGQFNSLNKAKNSTNDLLLQTATTDKHQLSTNTPWIKTTLANNSKSPLQCAKYPPAFKRIEQSLKSLDEKSSPVSGLTDFGKSEKHPNNEPLINKVTVDAGSAILNGNYL